MLRKSVYLDNAATSRFHPTESIREFEKAVRFSANPGRSSHDDAVRAGLKVMETREKLLSFFGCDGGYAVFTKNCTEALNLALLGSIPPNSHVITTVAEHNSTLRPLYHLARTKKIRLTVLPLSQNGHVPLYRIENAIRNDTFMVVINHVSNVNGVIADIAEIGKITAKHNVRLLVDTAQSAGHINIKMREYHIDAIAAPAHKGMLGLQGLGFLIFTDRMTPSPIIFGGTGTNSESVYHPKDAPEAFEAGTISYPLISALSSSIDFLKKEGKNIANNTAKLSNELIYGLKTIKKIKIFTPHDALTGVVGFNVGDMTSSEVSDILNERYGISVRAGLHCAPLMHNFLGTLEQGIVRASIGAENTQKDIERLLFAVEKIAKKHN